MADAETTRRTLEVDDATVRFTIVLEDAGACVVGSLIADDEARVEMLLEGLDARASVWDYTEDELRELYRAAAHLRTHLDEE